MSPHASAPSIFSPHWTAIVILGSAAIFAAPVGAQMTPGMLGNRAVEASFFLEDIRTSGIDSGAGLTLRGHIPWRDSFVVSVGGTLEKIDTNSFREKQVFGSFLAYMETGGVRPFAAASLANVWQSSIAGGTKFRSNEAFWALGAGVEAPVTDRTAFVGRIDYNRYFRQRFGDYWLYTVGFNHWLNERVAMIGSVTFRDNDSIYYGVGIGMKY